VKRIKENISPLVRVTNHLVKPQQLKIKGTVSVISSEPSCKDSNAQFTTVPLKPLSDQKCGRYRRFIYLKSVNFCKFFHCFLKTRNAQNAKFILYQTNLLLGYRCTSGIATLAWRLESQLKVHLQSL